MKNVFIINRKSVFFISGHPWLHGEDIPYCLEKWWVKGSADACCKKEHETWHYCSPFLFPTVLLIYFHLYSELNLPQNDARFVLLWEASGNAQGQREREIKKERQGGSYPDKWLINKTLEAKTNDPDPLWSITPELDKFIFNIWLNTAVTFYLTSDHSISNTTQWSCLKWKLSRAHCCI